MKPRILICDDDQSLVRRLSKFLGNDYDVMSSFTVQRSIEILQADRLQAPSERFAVVIIDLAFPMKRGGNLVDDVGFEILQEAKRDWFVEPIIYTSTGNEKKAYKAIASGAFRYVLKEPAGKDEKDLGDAVRQGVESHHAIVGLARVIDELAAISAPDSVLLKHAATAYKYIQSIRRRM